MATVLAPPVVGFSRQQQDTALFRRARTWLWIFVIVDIAGQNSWFTEAEEQSKQLTHLHQTYTQSGPILQILTLLIYLISFCLIYGHFKPLLQALLRHKLFFAYACFATLSVLWSQVPDQSLRKLPWLFLLTSVGWYIGLYYTAEEKIRITLTAGVIMAVSSALMVIALPRFGLDTGGEWKGVMGTKNQFGHAMLFLFSGILYRKDRRNRVFWVCAGLLGLLCLVKAHSAESLMLAGILVAVRFYAPLLRRTRREKIPFLLFAALASVLVLVVARVTILEAFGKDTTLTGRTNEWATLLPFAMHHFWVGYGYYGFWTGYDDSLQAMRLVGGAMHGADSGYVDLFLQFGIVGVSLAVVIMLVAMSQFWRSFAGGRASLTSYWYFSLILISFIGNYADAYFPLAGGAPEIMFIFSLAGIWQISIAERDGLHPTALSKTPGAFFP